MQDGTQEADGPTRIAPFAVTEDQCAVVIEALTLWLEDRLHWSDPPVHQIGVATIARHMFEEVKYR